MSHFAVSWTLLAGANFFSELRNAEVQLLRTSLPRHSGPLQESSPIHLDGLSATRGHPVPCAGLRNVGEPCNATPHYRGVMSRAAPPYHPALRNGPSPS